MYIYVCVCRIYIYNAHAYAYGSKLFEPQNVAVHTENMESPFLQDFLFFGTRGHIVTTTKAMTTPRLSIPDHPWHPHRLHLPVPGNGHKKTPRFPWEQRQWKNRPHHRICLHHSLFVPTWRKVRKRQPGKGGCQPTQG